MQDLSSLAKDGPWVTSQEGGNMYSDMKPAMTAPGSAPTTPVPKLASEKADPTVEDSDSVPVGSKPDRSGTGGGYTPSSVSWKVTQ